MLRTVYGLKELIGDAVSIKCKLLRTSKDNVVLINELAPHLEYSLIKMSGLNCEGITLNSFKRKGVVNIEIDGRGLESVLRRNIAALNEPITLRNLRNVKLCVNNECMNIDKVHSMSIINFFNEFILTIRSGNSYIIVDASGIRKSFKSVISGSEILGCQATLSTKDSLSITVWDRYEGISNEFKVSCNEIDGLSCNKNLCVVFCGRVSWVVSLNDIYPLPVKLLPLIRCGDEDYLYDPKHKLVVRSVHGELTPLALIRYPLDVDCLSNAKLIITLGDELSIIEGNLRKTLIRGSIKDVSAKGTMAIFNSGMHYRVINDDELEDIVIRSDQCILAREGIALCIIGNESLGLLDINNSVEPEVEVLSNTISSNSYVKVRIRPWFTTSELIIDDRLVLIESNAHGDNLEVSLRPKVLGWSNDVRLYVKDPLFTIAKVFPISSSAPKLINANVVKAAYISDGGIVTPNTDFAALLNIELSNEVPENAILKTSIEGLGVSNMDNVIINKGRTNVKLMIVGNVINEDVVKINLNVFYSLLKDEYNVGSITLRPKDYVIRNPLKESIKVLKRSNHEIAINVELDRSSMYVVCSNGYEFKSHGNNVDINLSKCKPPILVTITHSDPLFSMYLTEIIEYEPFIQVLEDSEFTVRSSRDYITLYMPKLNDELFEDIDVVSGGSNIKLRLNMKKLDIPIILVWVCGNEASYKYVPPKAEKVLLECNSLRLLEGLHLYALIPGKEFKEAPRKHFSIKDILARLLRYAIRSATTLSELVGFSYD